MSCCCHSHIISGHIASQHGQNKHDTLQHKLLMGAAAHAGLTLVAKYLTAAENAVTADNRPCNREAVSPVVGSSEVGGVDAEWNSLLWTMIMP